MIASLSGIVSHKYDSRVIVDVRGVGYEVRLTTRGYRELPPAGEKCSFFIHTNVREDDITLYGFADIEEKNFFLLLNKVSGVGPKLALTILSALPTPELCRAISTKNLSHLTALPGIGKKTAQRLCMELHDKLSDFEHLLIEDGIRHNDLHTTQGGELADAASALVNLGYQPNIAHQALTAVNKKFGDQTKVLKVEELIREALKVLA